MFWENSKIVSTRVQASGWSFRFVSTSWATRCYRTITQQWIYFRSSLNVFAHIITNKNFSKCREIMPINEFLKWPPYNYNQKGFLISKITLQNASCHVSRSPHVKERVTWDPMSWYMELTTLSNRLMSSFWLKSSSCLAGWSANIVISAGIEILIGDKKLNEYWIHQLSAALWAKLKQKTCMYTWDCNRKGLF